MNTKKILFAVAAFGMLALATYVPNTSVDQDNTENFIPRDIDKKNIKA